MGRGWGSARCRARDAAGGCRASLETSVRNRRAAAFAHTERSRFDACERSVDRGESATSLVSQRRDLRPGDGDRRTLRVVLVVDVRIARRLDDVGPTLIQPPQASHRLPTFLDQQRASSVRGHAPIVRSPSANPPRHRDERQWAELHRSASRRDGDASRRPPRHASRRSATPGVTAAACAATAPRTRRPPRGETPGPPRVAGRWRRCQRVLTRFAPETTDVDELAARIRRVLVDLSQHPRHLGLRVRSTRFQTRDENEEHRHALRSLRGDGAQAAVVEELTSRLPQSRRDDGVLGERAWRAVRDGGRRPVGRRLFDRRLRPRQFGACLQVGRVRRGHPGAHELLEIGISGHVNRFRASRTPQPHDASGACCGR